MYDATKLQEALKIATFISIDDVWYRVFVYICDDSRDEDEEDYLLYNNEDDLDEHRSSFDELMKTEDLCIYTMSSAIDIVAD